MTRRIAPLLFTFALLAGILTFTPAPAQAQLGPTPQPLCGCNYCKSVGHWVDCYEPAVSAWGKCGLYVWAFCDPDMFPQPLNASVLSFESFLQEQEAPAPDSCNTSSDLKAPAQAPTLAHEEPEAETSATKAAA